MPTCYQATSRSRPDALIQDFKNFLDEASADDFNI